MNKLASLAIVAFLLLGGLMWYAANGSMQQYLVDYQRQVLKQLPPESKFYLQDVQFASAENKGMLTGVQLTIPTGATHTAGIKIDNLYWQYEKRSLKKDVVVVEYLTIPSVQLSLPVSDPKKALAQLSTTLQGIINQAENQALGINGRKEFQITINKVLIENLFITLANQATPIEEVIASNIEISEQAVNNTHQMSVSGAYLLNALAEKANDALIIQGK